MLLLYGLAYLYDVVAKRNVTGNFPEHEASYCRPGMRKPGRPQEERSPRKGCPDTRKSEKRA